MRRPPKKHSLVVIDRTTGREIRQIQVAGRPPRPFVRPSPDEVVNLDRKIGLKEPKT